MSCIELPQMAPPEYLHPKGVKSIAHPKGVKSIAVLDVIITSLKL